MTPDERKLDTIHELRLRARCEHGEWCMECHEKAIRAAVAEAVNRCHCGAEPHSRPIEQHADHCMMRKRVEDAVAEERERLRGHHERNQAALKLLTEMQEREACARVAELACYEETPAGNRIAAAIRARGK